MIIYKLINFINFHNLEFKIKSKLIARINIELAQQKQEQLFRTPNSQMGLIDFCSNDYFGFANSNRLKELTNNILVEYNHSNGSTGSRLISGNNPLIEIAESEITHFFKGESGLIFNSGYDANIGFFSTIPNRNDTILYDEYIHASIRDGIRLCQSKSFSFKHNSIVDLKSKLQKARGEIFIVVESIYSMDGDESPLVELNELCKNQGYNLIVDEAHSTGFSPKGNYSLCENYGVYPFARLHTFGKAMGCHGAVWISSNSVKNYLINFCRAFIYTTALPPHSIAMMLASIQNLKEEDKLYQILEEKINLFKKLSNEFNIKSIIPSSSPIQSIIIPGNENVISSVDYLIKRGFNVKAIRRPTVKEGSERIRISLHTYNSDHEIKELIKSLQHIKND